MSKASRKASKARPLQEADKIVAADAGRRHVDLMICLGLTLSILFVYAQVGGFDFVNYDDNLYVYQNAYVRAGLTLASIKWAFTAVSGIDYWRPISLLSHVVDAQLFGMKSGMHHWVSVCIHLLSSILLYLALRRATGARYLSGFVAFVFALHPLHVESVAWIAERKDVLGAFFWFLALYAYVWYAERPSPGRYVAVVVPFCLGLMSKPTLITFPFTLLLLDVWPLRRFQWPKTIWEKLPLIALSAVSSVVTYVVQKSAGALGPMAPAMRVENAFLSYVMYIGQMFWPTRLAVFYPYPSSIPAWKALAAAAILLIVSVLVMKVWRTRPYLAVGWLWYLGTLVPVIGLVRAGGQSHADRYMYVPIVGLSVMLAWGGADVVKRWPRTKSWILAAGVLFCVACMAYARAVTAYWQNTETLFRQTLDVTQGNVVAEYDLATYLGEMRRYDEAIPHFEAALRIEPNKANAQSNLGVALRLKGQCEAAIPHFEAALRAQPVYQDATYNLGRCEIAVGNYASAAREFAVAARANPNSAGAHFWLGTALSKIPGRSTDAIEQYETALRLSPGDATVHSSLGELLADLHRTPEAIAHLETAQRLHADPSIAKLLDRLRAGQK
jgi:tetratricopeptide (TPR) repeat protein